VKGVKEDDTLLEAFGLPLFGGVAEGMDANGVAGMAPASIESVVKGEANGGGG
jgi:hypothetical protein